MPFDSTTFRQPHVTVLPPQPHEPLERGGRPQRIVINIEIVQRQAPQPATRRGYRFGTLTGCGKTPCPNGQRFDSVPTYRDGV
jgi:hypothetical protein